MRHEAKPQSTLYHPNVTVADRHLNTSRLLALCLHVPAGDSFVVFALSVMTDVARLQILLVMEPDAFDM